jgi:hypothetical protein
MDSFELDLFFFFDFFFSLLMPILLDPSELVLSLDPSSSSLDGASGMLAAKDEPRGLIERCDPSQVKSETIEDWESSFDGFCGIAVSSNFFGDCFDEDSLLETNEEGLILEPSDPSHVNSDTIDDCESLKEERGRLSFEEIVEVIEARGSWEGTTSSENHFLSHWRLGIGALVKEERLLPEPSESIQVNSETTDACDSSWRDERGDGLSFEDAAAVGLAVDVKLAVDSSLSRSVFIR